MDQGLQQYLDDKFAGLPSRDEFRVLETKIDALQQTLNKTDTRDKEDSNALAKDILKHDARITKLETDVHALKLQNIKA